MLSHRATRNVALEDLPWRSAPGLKDKYHPVDNPDGVVVFCTAENSLVHTELADFVAEKAFDTVIPAARIPANRGTQLAFPKEVFTYRYSTGGGQRFPTAMAAHINRHFKPHKPISAAEIVTASALTGIHELLGHALADRGDVILTIPPVYGRFELDFGNTVGLRVVYAEMGGCDHLGEGEEIVQRLRAALTRSASAGCMVRALLIVNPNNPLGRCYPPETLELLMRFCQTNGLHFVSDEVYALSVYEIGEAGTRPFTSALAIDTSDLIEDERLHVLYGMSKDFGAAGLRIGCLLTRNLLLRKAMNANTRFHGVSGPSLAIAAAILEDESFVDGLLATSRERLAENRRIAIARLADAGIDWHKGGNAGFFLYIDLSPWLRCTQPSGNAEFELADKLLKAGVGLHPGEEHCEKKGWFRLIFSMDTEILDEGLKRLINALGLPWSNDLIYTLDTPATIMHRDCPHNNAQL